ncbi:hypothetical protein [Deinococcus marmoris]|uniref:Uncharacterized protein n=1 Tax=Deinococcus marmoris TaxID=249408 RepID=A0A1U7P1I8_9DEIO|nr:hypothetical protein [Deinococcus marmoris]OLV19037.1 hypothetical protein BOO71_0003811 [Deinococcus marmoris]
MTARPERRLELIFETCPIARQATFEDISSSETGQRRPPKLNWAT